MILLWSANSMRKGTIRSLDGSIMSWKCQTCFHKILYTLYYIKQMAILYWMWNCIQVYIVWTWNKAICRKITEILPIHNISYILDDWSCIAIDQYWLFCVLIHALAHTLEYTILICTVLSLCVYMHVSVHACIHKHYYNYGGWKTNAVCDWINKFWGTYETHKFLFWSAWLTHL